MRIIKRSSDESEITMIFNNKTYLLKKARDYYWFVKIDDRLSLITNSEEKYEVSKEYHIIILREKKLERILK